MGIYIALLVSVAVSGCTKDFCWLPAAEDVVGDSRILNGYTSACARVSARFFGLAIRVASNEQREHLHSVSDAFDHKACAPDTATRDFFDQWLIDDYSRFPTVFGTLEIGLRAFEALVAAREFEGTPNSLKQQLTRTFQRIVRNERANPRLSNEVIKAYIRLMDSVIPLTPSEPVPVDEIQLGLTNIEAAGFLV